MSGPIGIPCGEIECRHHDAARARCGLLPPVGRHDTIWIFALAGCPIAAAYAALVAGVDRARPAPAEPEESWRRWRAARLHTTELHAAGERTLLIDLVVERLVEGADVSSDSALRHAARERLLGGGKR